MADALPAPAVDPETVRRTVDDVLARPEYRPLEPGIVDRVLGWLSEQLGRLIELIASGGAGGIVAALVVLTGLVVVVVLVVRFLRRVRPDPGVDTPVTGQVGRGSREWLEEAAQQEAAGRWRAALRSRYRALVAELAAAGLVDEVPGRTTGEYRREGSAALPVAAAALDAATDAFERAWYGDAPVDAALVRDFAAHAEVVHDAVGRRRPAEVGGR